MDRSAPLPTPCKRDWAAEIKSTITNNNLASFSSLLLEWRSSASSSSPPPSAPPLAASIHPTDEELSSLALSVALSGVSAEFLQALQQAGWEVTTSLPPTTSAYFLKSALRNEALTSWLLEQGLDPNILVSRSKNITALTYAAYYSPPAILSLLLLHKASITESRALSAAVLCRSSSWEIKLDILLRAGADVNALELELPWLIDPVSNYPTVKGTPLHWTAYWGFRDRGARLVERGADVGIRNSEGLTAAEVGEMARKSGRLYRGWSRKLFSEEALDRAEEDRISRLVFNKDKALNSSNNS